MFNSRFRIASAAGIGSALVGLVLAVGSADAAPGVSLASRDSGHTVLATVEQGDRTIEFVRSAEGDILGVAEIAPAGTPSLLAGSMRDLAPDEIYDALVGPQVASSTFAAPTLVPIATPPATLAMQTPIPSSTPTVQLRTSPTQGGSPDGLVPVGSDYCAYDFFAQPGDSEFASDWYHDLGQYQDESHQETHEEIALDHVQPDGAIGGVWMLGPSVQRWLGVCNGSEDTPNEVFFFAETRNYLGQWDAAYVANVPSGYQLIYTSFSPGNTEWRIRLAPVAFNEGDQEDLSVAAAWNEPIDTIVWQLPDDDGGEDPGPEGDAPGGARRTGLAGSR